MFPIRAISLAIILAVAPAAQAAITIIQHVKGHQEVAGNTAVCTLSATGASRNIIVGGIFHGSPMTGVTVTGVTDNIGNTYVAASGADGNRSYIWHSLAASAGVTAVTVTFSVAGTNVDYKACFAYELSGAVTFDAASHVDDGLCASKVCTGSAVTTATTTGFVIGVMTGTTITTVNPESGNEFTSGGDVDLVPSGSPTFGMGASASLLSSTAAAHQPAWHAGPGNSIVLDRFWSSTAAYKQ